MPPTAHAAAPLRRKGTFTIKFAAVFFVISGFLSLLSVTSPVPMFGAMHGGIVAIIHNLVFIIFFFAIGIGLWRSTAWGYQALMAGTILYSADKLLFGLDRATRQAYLDSSEAIQQIKTVMEVDMNMLHQGIMLMCLVSVGCWWGFAGYIYLRRDYFQ